MPAVLRFPGADFAQECSNASREVVAASAMHPTPCFPHIADEHSGEQVVDDTSPFEEREADAGYENAADDLVRIFRGRCGRVGQDDEREEESCFEIGRAVYFRDPARISYVRG